MFEKHNVTDKILMLVEWEVPVERHKRGKNMLWQYRHNGVSSERKQLLYTWRY
jgi:hypothetical protein